MNFQRSYFSSATPAGTTPVKPRLGRFVDVYSPEHLNISPEPPGSSRFAVIANEKHRFSTPTQRSKCDKCRTDKAKEKNQNVWRSCSFEGNQSFPMLKHNIRPVKMDLETPTKLKTSVDVVRVDGPNGLRFNTSLPIGDASGSPAQSQTERLQHNITNKAVFTIEPKTTKILIVNNKACSLLGYSSSELCNLLFCDLLHNRANQKKLTLHVQDGDTSEDGTAVLLAGKVVELVSKDGAAIQVSLWIRQLDADGPCLVVAEPVTCRNVIFTVEAETGTITRCEGADACALFEAESRERLVGLPIACLLPAVRLPPAGADVPRSLAKQKATGRTLDGCSFPLCLWISRPESKGSSKANKEQPTLQVTVRVTYNVSGLLVVDEWGAITACNQHFAQLTFGKSQRDVVGRHIADVIQHFCRESDRLRPPHADTNMTLSPVQRLADASDTDDDSCGAFNGSQKSACTSLNAQPSLLSSNREKSSSALCLDKSSSLVTHTPTPTRDTVSSLSSTEQRNDTSALPDLTSGMSGVSIDDAPFPPSLSKSRSEDMLRADSIYYTSQHSQELTPTGACPRTRLDEPAARRRPPNEDRSSLSLDLCDSNETSADFLTPINELPPSGCEAHELPRPDGFCDAEAAPSHNFQTRGGARGLVATSTPAHARTQRRADEGEWQWRDGTYRGLVVHHDGSELGVVYTVSSMQTASGRCVRCVWLGVRREEAPRHATLASSLASTADNSLLLGNKSASSRPRSVSLMSQCGEEQVVGEFARQYVTLKQIGKGAYGCVKMAYRRADRLLVVAKFILKEKVGAQFWVDGAEGRKLPLELSLLTTLQHPNIVSVVDAFENDKYFQMVMEKHGAGMDLFEFIERRPALEEPLLSYIFRQIGQAVEYLHSLGILHRDIKDENVIIDNKFHVKLIDFGSAAFMSRDALFSTFYGTTEYCSPEVLAGNRYRGPELEMWSMGITLYVLAFFVNPFADIEDTIQGPLSFPHLVSDELEHLLRWMLCKEPSQRCSVAQLMAHPWLRQPVSVAHYAFHELVACDRREANPEAYYSGSLSPRSGSPVSLALDALAKETSHLSEAAARSEGKNASKEERRRDAHSDNYSLRSSADILEISSKPASEAALTDVSSDATGHAACDFDIDAEPCCDSWDECEPDSFS